MNSRCSIAPQRLWKHSRSGCASQQKRRRRLGKNFLSCCSIGRVRSCVRPVLCGGEAAGHNALRGSGPNQKHAFKDALTQTGSPDLRIDLVCITSSCPRQFLQTSNAVVVSWPHLLESPCFDANQSIALRCRRVGAVHSIKSGKAQNEHITSALHPKADIDRPDGNVRLVPNRTRAPQQTTYELHASFDPLVGGSCAPSAATLSCGFHDRLWGPGSIAGWMRGTGAGALHAAGPHAVPARQIVFKLAQPFAPGQPQCIVRPIRPGCVPVLVEG